MGPQGETLGQDVADVAQQLVPPNLPPDIPGERDLGEGGE
jgi:hypothetical protein